MSKFTYNRLLIMGNCESGRVTLRNLFLKTGHVIFDKSLEETINYKKIISYDILEYVTKKIPENKILCMYARNPEVLNNLNAYDFSSWRFVYPYRDIHNAFASYKMKVDRDIDDIIRFVYGCVSNTEIFYNKIRHLCFRVNVNHILNNTNDTIKQIFKFTELPLPDEEEIKESIHSEPLIVNSRENKIHINDSFNEYLSKIEKERFRDFLKSKGNNND